MDRPLLSPWRSTPGIRSAGKEELMSRNVIAGLGLVLGAAMIAGMPALAAVHVTEAVVQPPVATAADDIADRIEQLWASSKELTETDIEARMDGAVVILQGEVSKESQRETAERLAKRIKGVTEIDNQIALRVEGATQEGTKGSVLAGDVTDTTRATAGKAEDALDKTGSAVEHAAEVTRDAVVTGAQKTRDAVTAAPGKIDETWITTKIAGKINADDVLDNVDVDVQVKKNVVTITGDVPSVGVRDRVLRIARETEGVARVIDNMNVRPGSQQ
jgi:osmotically-inducible protein OsmY